MRVRTLLLSAGLLAACTPVDTLTDAAPGLLEAPVPLEVTGIQRLDAKEPLRAGTVADFRLRLRGMGLDEVRWSASAGTVVGDGTEASWLLPDLPFAQLHVEVISDEDEVIEASFDFDIIPADGAVMPAVSPLAQGLVDPTPDSITGCELAIDGADVPHVLYRSGTHAQLWHAEFTGGSWNIEFVDGPGFDVGGLIDTQFDMVLDSAGAPHIVYRYQSTGEVRYASPSGASWIREGVATNYDSYGGSSGRVGLALDPLNGQRPTVGFTHYDAFNNDYYPVLAFRTGTGAWTESPYVITTWGNWFTGGITFTASGVAWLTFEPEDFRVLNWSASSGFFGEEVPDSSFGYSDYAPVRLDGSNQPVAMNDESVWHRVGGNWMESRYEISDTSWYDLGVTNAGSPRMLVRHESGLEFVSTNTEGYWLYEDIDSMDSAKASVAVDSSGNTHACYIKDGEIWFY